jgi:hypothetical protein
MKDKRYKTGSSLTATDKERCVDRILGFLDLDVSVSGDMLHADLMKVRHDTLNVLRDRLSAFVLACRKNKSENPENVG